MSADNYYEINPEQLPGGGFRFGLNMGFASDEREEAIPNGPRTRWFDTLDAALAVAAEEYAEYGYGVIHNDAWSAYRAEQHAAAEAADAVRLATARAEGIQSERARITRLLLQIADYRAEELNPNDLAAPEDTLPHRAYEALAAQIQYTRVLALAVETGSTQALAGWLPAWRVPDRILTELGLGAPAAT